MDTTSINGSVYLSEIEFHGKDYNNAYLNCHVPENANVSILVQDEFGRRMFEEFLELEKGEHSILLNIPHLKNGVYHAWVYVLENTFIRRMYIEKEIMLSRPWITKIMSFFG